MFRTFQIGKSIGHCIQTQLFRGFHSITSGSITNTLVLSLLSKPNSFGSSILNLNTSLLTRLISSPLVNQFAGFKVKGRLKRRCKDCYFVMRQQRLYVICKTHPRHKQMSMKQRDYKSWILTHATQSKIRPY